MTSVVHPNDALALPTLRGHTVAFVDSNAACDAVMQALNAAGFPNGRLQVLWGEDGLHLLERITHASSWGETAEDVLQQGAIALENGHSLVFVEVQNAEEAATVVAVSSPHGAHSIYHFGSLIDTRLTA
jgi:hypothetical protein